VQSLCSHPLKLTVIRLDDGLDDLGESVELISTSWQPVAPGDTPSPVPPV
jgi:hypothetical protein